MDITKIKIDEAKKSEIEILARVVDLPFILI
jgi:hypothetical protein